MSVSIAVIDLKQEAKSFVSDFAKLLFWLQKWSSGQVKVNYLAPHNVSKNESG